MKAPEFSGEFAGKLSFLSTNETGKKFYLTVIVVPDGKGGNIIMPSFNGQEIIDKEKFIIYKDPDGYYRLQSGDLRWLSVDKTESYFEYGKSYEDAAPIDIGGEPFGSQLFFIKNGEKVQVYYTIQSNPTIPNLLSLVGGEGSLMTCTPGIITPSLEVIINTKNGVRADLSKVHLIDRKFNQGIDFTFANFQKAEMAGVDFSNAILDNADFSNTNLQGLNWGSPKSAVGINLSNSNASDCVFGGQKEQLNCESANLSSATLIGTNLRNINLKKANLNGSILNNAKLDSATLDNAHLDNVIALKASFKSCTLIDVTAQSGNFIGACFDQANLTRIRMGASRYLFLLPSSYNVQLDKNTFPKKDLIAVFSKNGVVLQGDSKIEATSKVNQWMIDDPSGPFKLILKNKGIQVFNVSPDLVPAVLREATFKKVVASSASLAGTDMRFVNWSEKPASLDHADLEDAVLTGAILMSTDFTQASLSGADFSQTNLIQSKFIGCIADSGGNHRAISFEQSHLEGADFTRATLIGALLTKAVVSQNFGVPLFILPIEYEQDLNNENIDKLRPVFNKFGFDLGTNATLKESKHWLIDNSSVGQAGAPKIYEITIDKTQLNIFGDGIFLFHLSSTITKLLEGPEVDKKLISKFKSNRYALAIGATITYSNSSIIEPDDDAKYLKPYRFKNMVVVKAKDQTSIYGSPPVQIEGFFDYPEGMGFGSSKNIDNALNDSSLGPSGLPFSWVKQKKITLENYFRSM